MKTTFIPTPTSRCRMGVARIEITPPIGMYHRMWGAAKHERSTGIHRPLFADAVVIESADASQRHVFAMLDHCMFRPPEMSELRRRMCELLKLPPERLTILFSHTHGAGLLTRERAHFPGGDLIGPYLDALPGRIAEVVNSAIKSVQPVTLTYGSVDCRMGHHRDAFDDAAGIFVCGFNPDIEWPLPVKTIRATNSDGKHVATLVNYPCHPTTLAWENTLVSPDYIGALRETVEGVTKAPCIFTLAPCGTPDSESQATAKIHFSDSLSEPDGKQSFPRVRSQAELGNECAYRTSVSSRLAGKSVCYEMAAHFSR